MSFQDLPPRRERLPRLPAQYEDGQPSYQDSGTGSAWYPGPPEYSAPMDTFPGRPRDAFDRGPRDAFDRGPRDAFDRGPRDTFSGTVQGPPWDVPPQRADSYAPLRRTGPFYAAADGEQESSIRRSRGLLAGAVAGFLAAAIALGAANLVAAFVRPQASPIIAVGGAFIDRTPSWLKNFAVQKFGENDKTMLLLGMYVTIALLAMVIGVIAWRHVSVGVVALALFGAFGAFVAFTRPESRLTDVIPSIAGGVVGIAAIVWLVRSRSAQPARSIPGYRSDRGEG
jgi:hypothetical protein